MLLLLLACAHHAPEAAPAVAPSAGAPPALTPPAAAPSAGAPPAAPPPAETPAPTGPTVTEEAAEAALLEAYAAVQRGDIAAARTQVDLLLRDAPTTDAATYAQRLRQELDLVGRPAAPLEVERWFQGSAALDANGTTLLIFFEAWCPHCQEEAPRVAEIASRFGPKGLVVVALTKETRGATDAMVTAFIHLHDWSFPVAKEREDTLSVAYGVEGVPAAALVKDGVIVWRGSPTVLSDEVLAAALVR